jgi:hypothetical protein
MMLTKPYNSNKEFCNGVAVSKIFGAWATASLIALQFYWWFCKHFANGELHQLPLSPNLLL